MDTGPKATANERTRLITTVQVVTQLERYEHSNVKSRFAVVAIRSTSIAIFIAAIFWVASSLLLSDPATDTQPQPQDSCFNTSRGYASAEALNNNIDGFCQDVSNNLRVLTTSRVWSRIYYPNSPEEYKMTVALSKRTSGFDLDHCIESMSSIINECEISVSGNNTTHWKHGGRRVQDGYEYTIAIFRHNRSWPPPRQPLQRCEGWYKFILHHFDIYGAGWANYDWGQKSLLPAVDPCCGPGSLSGWGFEYFDRPDENGYEFTA
ncbi:hypothetical protein SUNI508_06291 [Seiridium unicorne]|uniref:Uncharacterized protein n=1 Tax=Seiridium unicorne TaxID=138068 RepID=A0ABR2V214_9PEZI